MSTGEELIMYLTINNLTVQIDRLNKDIVEGDISEDQLRLSELSLRTAIEMKKHAISQTVHFGVMHPFDHQGVVTEAFWKSYGWWNNYFQNQLSSADRLVIKEAISTGGDLSKWIPKGDWIHK